MKNDPLDGYLTLPLKVKLGISTPKNLCDKDRKGATKRAGFCAQLVAVPPYMIWLLTRTYMVGRKRTWTPA
jgi:hypothetical protein